jgi:hypothetical protein
MTSLASRTVRTTAAVAGMAALGVGLAGNAMAAPSAPQSPVPAGLPIALPALPALPAVGNPLGNLVNLQSNPTSAVTSHVAPLTNRLAEDPAALPGTPGGAPLPMLFTVKSLRLPGEGSQIAGVRAPTSAPAGYGSTVRVNHSQVAGRDLDPTSSRPDQVGARSNDSLLNSVTGHSLTDQDGVIPGVGLLGLA